MALSGDGLFSRARNTADKYRKAQDDEGQLMENLVDEMDKTNPKKAGTPVEVPKGEEWNEDKVTPIADGKGSAIPIPNEFYYVGGDIDTGIVISDVEEDDLNNSKHGNQFVWIPCTAEEYENAKDDVIEKNWKCNSQYKDNGDDTGNTVTGGNGDGKAWHDDYTEEENKKIKETFTTIDTENWENNQPKVANDSLKKYKGFYVARFEAGVPEEAPFHYKNTERKYERIGRGASQETSSISSLKPVSQKGVQAWNFIAQPNAKMVSENMYKNDSKGANSYLIDNTAWNVICNKFNTILRTSYEGRSITASVQLGNYYTNETTKYTDLNVLWAKHKVNESGTTFATDYKIGNIQKSDIPKESEENRIELATGSSDDFKIYNIYDMAGNMWERTTGHNMKDGEIFVVPRGGSFKDDGNVYPIVRANGQDGFQGISFQVGFRVVLYI